MRQLTKILATLGPSSSDEDVLQRLVEAGASAFRINFSHGENSARVDKIASIRRVEEKTGTPLAIIGDLSGPKIRVGEMEPDVVLADGAELVIQAEPVVGNADRVSCSLPELLADVKAGESVLMYDGRLRLEVVQEGTDAITCRVLVGGSLPSRKGINLPDSDLTLSALTNKDREDVEFIARHEFDYVALSFVQRASDLEELRALLWGYDRRLPIIAKIEKPLAVERIDTIIDASDAIMVARGDMAVEMDFPLVPVAQKRIAWKCAQAGKPCLIATEMMESMVHSATPTRAEVSDVANAVLDGADAVMLSAETAVGKHPIKTVRMMSRVICEILSHPDITPPMPEDAGSRLAVSRAVKQMLDAENIAVAVVFSRSGASALQLCKTLPPCPILSISPEWAVVRRMALFRGVTPAFCEEQRDIDALLHVASETAVRLGLAKPGERLMLVSSRNQRVPGSVDGLIVHELP